ncbi:MAG: type II toxin-antitoxin system PemK/MazF family toxin [Novosphingobium sp.]
MVVATGPGFGTKPRPCVVLQSDHYAVLPTVILLPITTDLSEPPSSLRTRLDPGEANGLRRPSEVMADIPITTRTQNVHQHVGRVSDSEMARIERALLLVLGFGE